MIGVVPGDPVEESGILKGGLITKVDVRLIGYQAALSRLDAEAGEIYSLEIVRRTEGQAQGELVTTRLEVAHEEYQDVTVEAYPLGGLGYLSILSFTEDTEPQFLEAVESLKGQGASRRFWICEAMRSAVRNMPLRY